MRTSRIATMSCAALLGLGSLVGLSAPAEAAPSGVTPPIVATPQGGGFGPKVATGDLTTPTTTPAPTPPVQGDLVLVDPGHGEPQPHDEDDAPAGDVAVDSAGAAVDPDPDCVPVPGGPDCVPDTDCVPGAACPEQEPCSTYVECCEQGITLNPERPCPGDDPCEERPTSGVRSQDCCIPEEGTDGPSKRNREDCPGDEDPCRPDDTPSGQAVRTAEDCCPETGTDGGDRPTARSEGSRDDCPGTGTDGGDGGDGGSDGGGRLPKTGAEMATYGVAGLGFVGLGAFLRRLGRKQA